MAELTVKKEIILRDFGGVVFQRSVPNTPSDEDWNSIIQEVYDAGLKVGEARVKQIEKEK